MARALLAGVLAAAALLTASCASGPDPARAGADGGAGGGAGTEAGRPGAPSIVLPTPTVPESPTTPAQPPLPSDSGAPPSTTPTRDSLADLAEGLAGSMSAGADRTVLGADVSWPQCPAGMGIPQKRSHGGPMPVAQARYVVVGLTNGPGFVANPCLADQVTWVRERRLRLAAYAVASYPDTGQVDRYGDDGPYDGATDGGALANTGYQQARFNVASMRAARLTSPVVWVDVEPVPHFDWSSDPNANAAVVAGAVRGYQDAGLRVGVYSTAALWRHVVGDLELGLPEWRAAGQTSQAEALRRCGDEATIQGGPSVLAQWVEAGRDLNVTCPGTSLALDLWFHRT